MLHFLSWFLFVSLTGVVPSVSGEKFFSFIFIFTSDLRWAFVPLFREFPLYYSYPLVSGDGWSNDNENSPATYRKHPKMLHVYMYTTVQLPVN